MNEADVETGARDVERIPELFPRREKAAAHGERLVGCPVPLAQDSRQVLRRKKLRPLPRLAVLLDEWTRARDERVHAVAVLPPVEKSEPRDLNVDPLM